MSPKIHRWKIYLEQESPPASTQEAYRPPRSHSNFLLLRTVGRGGPLTKFFFPSLNMYQAKSGVKNFSLYWDWVPPAKNLGTPPKNLRPGTPPKIWDLGPPPKHLRPGTPPGNLRPGTPPKSETWDPPSYLDLDLGPPPKVWTDTQTGVKTLPSLVLRTRAVITSLSQPSITTE